VEVKKINSSRPRTFVGLLLFLLHPLLLLALYSTVQIWIARFPSLRPSHAASFAGRGLHPVAVDVRLAIGGASSPAIGGEHLPGAVARRPPHREHLLGAGLPPPRLPGAGGAACPGKGAANPGDQPWTVRLAISIRPPCPPLALLVCAGKKKLTEDDSRAPHVIL
jgi:hypothetical protein